MSIAHNVIKEAVASGRIHLSEMDEKIFSLMKEVIRHCQLKDTLRVAGGWVRDKLLNRSSLDIDITSDLSSGKDIAESVKKYLEDNNMRDSAKFKIRHSAQQSEHLDVATIEVFDMEIDFNRLRKEAYDASSRIPSIESGNEFEDTARRDFTINALYYNINEDCIEDFTDSGLDDLEKGLVRTTGDPIKSFKEDPVRVLRAIRYAGRYNFKLDENTRNAIINREVKAEFENTSKVSLVRYGAEVEKIFKADNAIKCMSLICDLDLYGLLFPIPDSFTKDPIHEQIPFPYFPVKLNRIASSELMKASMEIANISGAEIVDLEEQLSHDVVRKIVLSAFFSPLWGYVYTENKAKGLERSLVYHILQRGLGMKKVVVLEICKMLKCTQGFQEASRAYLKYVEDTVNEEETRKTKHKEAKIDAESRKMSLLLTMLSGSSERLHTNCELPEHIPIAPPVDVEIAIGRTIREGREDWRAALRLADVFARHFHAFVIQRYLPSCTLGGWISYKHVGDCYEWKEFVNGKDLKDLAAKNPERFNINSKDIGEYLQHATDYLITRGPEEGSKEDCVLYVMEKWEEKQRNQSSTTRHG
eukprot:m.64035 g.64035  ORF g.64035 m.64035 type:complete len:587 (+) comp8097_c0_seq2:57-1817(+)